MQELKDLVDNITEGQNIIYEWENKDDHQLNVSFSTNELSLKYEFDIDELHITKTANNKVDFSEEVSSIDEGLEIIEKDIQSILGISESNKFNIGDLSDDRLEITDILAPNNDEDSEEEKQDEVVRNYTEYIAKDSKKNFYLYSGDYTARNSCSSVFNEGCLIWPKLLKKYFLVSSEL